MLTGPVPGFSPYQPKRNEPYMSDAQLDHFRQILQAWKRELMEEVDRTMHHMKDDASNPPDPNRPVATLCVEAQERRELAEKQFRDREDYYR